MMGYVGRNIRQLLEIIRLSSKWIFENCKNPVWRIARPSYLSYFYSNSTRHASRQLSVPGRVFYFTGCVTKRPSGAAQPASRTKGSASNRLTVFTENVRDLLRRANLLTLNCFTQIPRNLHLGVWPETAGIRPTLKNEPLWQ